MWKILNANLVAALFVTACSPTPTPSETVLTLPADVYFDKVRGAWQAIMVANHTGLVHEGKYLDEPNPADSIELVLLDQ